ncbi:MAG: hypothetical protein V1909_00060, partial [Candidatus Micrarchaeota archaeon]
DAIKEVYSLEISGIVEHKVSSSVFLRDTEKAGLRVAMDVPVWQPDGFRHDNAGSRVIILEKSY